MPFCYLPHRNISFFLKVGIGSSPEILQVSNGGLPIYSKLCEPSHSDAKRFSSPPPLWVVSFLTLEALRNPHTTLISRSGRVWSTQELDDGNLRHGTEDNLSRIAVSDIYIRSISFYYYRKFYVSVFVFFTG
jgi:hypothetical protein